MGFSKYRIRNALDRVQAVLDRLPSQVDIIEVRAGFYADPICKTGSEATIFLSDGIESVSEALGIEPTKIDKVYCTISYIEIESVTIFQHTRCEGEEYEPDWT